MSKDLNKVTLIGRLGQDPEVRYTGSGTAVVNNSLATSEKWNSKDNGAQEHTEWHRLVFWDKLGELLAQYCKKGSKIYVEGALRTRSYDKDGITRYVVEIRVSDMIMLDGKGNASEGHTGAPSGNVKPAETPAPDDGFDDIPF